MTSVAMEALVSDFCVPSPFSCLSRQTSSFLTSLFQLVWGLRDPQSCCLGRSVWLGSPCFIVQIPKQNVSSLGQHLTCPTPPHPPPPGSASQGARVSWHIPAPGAPGGGLALIEWCVQGSCDGWLLFLLMSFFSFNSFVRNILFFIPLEIIFKLHFL